MFSSVCMQNGSADRVGAVWQNEKKKSADGNWASRCAELIWTRAYRLKDVISRWILSILLCKILVSFFLQVSFNILKCSFHIVRLWFDIFLCFRLWFSFSDFHEIIFIKIIIQIRIPLKNDLSWGITLSHWSEADAVSPRVSNPGHRNISHFIFTPTLCCCHSGGRTENGKKMVIIFWTLFFSAHTFYWF